MEYKISYHSHNQYFNTVKDGIFEFLVLPENNEDQLVSTWKIKNSLLEEPFYYFNMFGFRVCRIKASKPFSELSLEMKVKVQKNTRGITNGLLWETQKCHDLLQDDIFKIDHHLFLQSTTFTSLSETNHHLFPSLQADQHPYKYLSHLNTTIHQFFTYTPNITDVHTKVNDLIELKKGVCQDYAHLMIAIARLNQIPARYVSGFLNQGKGYLGAAKMHAWLECYVPGAGWIGFDPTNHLKTDENYIKVAHGCDYKDCAPIKGVIKTNGKQITDHEVVVHTQ
jgi:hypothetical protein